MLAVSRVSPMLAVSQLPTRLVPADSLVVFAFPFLGPFAVLQSRVHEVWARFFSSTLEERLRYAPSDCFRTFPFPENFETDAALEAVGEAYHAFRANLMIERNEGSDQDLQPLPRTRRKSRPTSPACARFTPKWMPPCCAPMAGTTLPTAPRRNSSSRMQTRAKRPKTRFDWPAEFKDEVLARLLALNAERAAAERAAGLTVAAEEDDEEIGDEVDAE